MWPVRRPIVPTMKGDRHRSKGGGLGVPPGQLQGREGRNLPPSLNPQEMMRRRRMKMRKRRK
jgi:hypothetical protein